MQSIKKYFRILTMALLVGLLTACSTASTPVSVTELPVGSQESTSMPPIIGTAITDGAQELPQPTATIAGEMIGTSTVTLDQNGQTLIFQPGDRFVLMLGEGYTWDVSITQPAIVSEVMGVMPVKGSQGVFETHQTGQTELSASGDPLCRSQKPACMQPSIAFTIKIVVK
jgi:hypothetical protein